MKLSIAIVSWNTKKDTAACLESIVRHRPECGFEVILVDNGSEDGSVGAAEKVMADSGIEFRLIRNEGNRGFAGANNQAYEVARGEYFLLLNPDTILRPGSLDILVDYLDENAEVAGVTAKLLNLDGSLQFYMHRDFPDFFTLMMALAHKRWPRFRPGSVRRYLYLDEKWERPTRVAQPAAACLMVRRECIDDAGGLFDEELFPIFYNDVDLCYRLYQAGGEIVLVPKAEIVHNKGAVTSKIEFYKSGKLYSLASLFYFKKHRLWASYLGAKVVYTALFSALTAVSAVEFLVRRIDGATLRERAKLPGMIIREEKIVFLTRLFS